MVGNRLQLGDPRAATTNRRQTGEGPNPTRGATPGRVSPTPDNARADRKLSRNARKPLFPRTWPTIVLVGLLGGCAVHNGTKQLDVEPDQGQPPAARLLGRTLEQRSSDGNSAMVRRLPPVADAAHARSLATTDSPTPGVTLKVRTGPQYRDEKPAQTLQPSLRELPAPKRIASHARGSQTVPAVFWPDPGTAATGPPSAQAIPAEWRQGPGSVTRVSHEDPSGQSVATDVFDQPGETARHIQFEPPETPPTQTPRPEQMPVPEPEMLTPVRLRCDGVDVRKALEMLSNEASVSILVAPGVTGLVTANLQGLSFDEALDAILKLCNLVAHRENNLILVYPLAEAPQSTRSLRAFPLDYVSAPDAILGVQGLLSPTGQAFLTQSSPEDNRRMQDVIVVDDLPEYLFRIEQYVAQIDRPPRQVLIEVHVLEVELEDDRRHGVNFEHVMNIMGNAARVRLRGLADPLAAQAFFLNLDGANLDALIECLKTTTDAKTLASPKVLVLNGQKARIQIGEQLGYRVMTATETTSMEDVKFLELGVVLDVTPHISRDNQVVLRVKPKVSGGQINSDRLPEEETTEVETDVLLMDGQGMVIGGLIQETDSNVQSKIPLLGDIWLIGRLFQRRELEKRRNEIIITLIPRVLPYLPEYELQDQLETTRAATPLLHGPLCRFPRPWEPSLPDTECRLRDLRCWPGCR